MKRNLLSLILLYLVFFNLNTLFAKKDTTTYFCNSSLKKINKKYAPYYIKVFKMGNGKIGVHQYTTEKNIYMRGSFLDNTLETKHGPFEYYYNSGSLKRKCNYLNNKKNGTWETYRENGVLKSKGEYIDDEKNGTWETYTENRVLKSKGQYIDDEKTGLWIVNNLTDSIIKKSNYLNGKLSGKELQWYKDSIISSGQYELGKKNGYWQNWFQNRNINSKGSYINGKRHGEWRFYFESGALAALEIYENGVATNVKWFNELGHVVKPIEPYEIKAEYPGGRPAMLKHIRNTLIYPDIAMENGEQGTVWVEFKISIDGVKKDIKIFKGVSKSIDEEVLRVTKLMPNWTPWLNHNRKYPITFQIPVKITLN